jgi:hypothetical protein
VVSRDRKQASVIEEVPLGFMRSILIDLVEDPVTEERGSESAMTGNKRGSTEKQAECY